MAEQESTVVLYGTPLEELLQDEVPGKKSVQDLTVRDEKGRQRFHGAFTGGFSAGYFNSVGTKEGWTPRTFQSSRSDKAFKHKQRPEDYMDAEDLNEFGIAPRRIQTTKNFREEEKSNVSEPEKSFYKECVIPGLNPLAEIIQPASQHIGIRLLRAMGWKPGQGVGPRIKKQTPTSSNIKIYGCSLPNFDTLAEEEADEYAAAFTFAPQDIAGLPFTPKDNLNGIGYSGIKSTSLLEDKYDLGKPTTTRAVFKTGKKIAIRGQAFGVGALEDDDDDIYGKDDMSQYDFQLSEAKEASNSAKRNSKAIQSSSGQIPVSGFSLATRPPPSKKIYLPPKVSPDFVPINLRLAQLAEKLAPPTPTASSSQIPTEANITNKGRMFLNRHILSAEERAQMLGSRFRSADPQSRLTSDSSPVITTGPIGAQDYQPRIPEPVPSPSNSQQPHFQAFASQPDKQKRYQIYLEMQRVGRTDFITMQPTSMTDWEKEKELEEFHRASVLYRPLASGLSNRFVSRGTNSEEQEDPNKIKDKKLTEKKNSEDEKPKKAFPIRIVCEWHPDKLLCKRFNVPNPFPNSALLGTIEIGNKEKVSIFGFLGTTSNDQKINSNPKPPEDVAISTPTSILVSSIPLPDAIIPKLVENVVPQSQLKINNNNQSEKEETEEKRPPVDFFKAIFLDTDESQSEMEEEIDEPPPPPIEKVPMPKQAPSGIFASLADTSQKPESLVSAPVSIPVVSEEQDMFYGPVLPPPLALVRLSPQPKRPSLDLETRGEKRHKKRKSKKEKHKKKRKKSRRRSSSSSQESSDEDEDEIDSKIIQTYKRLKRKTR